MASKDNNNRPITLHDLELWGGELARRLDECATKEDLKQALKDYPTKEDLKQTLKEYATKEDLRQFKDEIIFEFKALAELIHDDLAGANKDEISGIQDNIENHEERITVLEKR